MPIRFTALVSAFLLATALLAGCGGDSAPSASETRFAMALATVPGAEPLGTGYGWIDVERMRESGGNLSAELDWAAGALGPGGRDIAKQASTLAPTGISPLEADSMITTVTSYTLGLRLDGVDSARAEAALVEGGARKSRDGEWTNLDFGAEWTIPDAARLEPLGSLAARSAVRPGSVLLARSNLARTKMMSSDEPAIEREAVDAAADCVGDVIAARIVLNNHTHLPNSGPDLLAFGTVADPEEPPREVLCAVGSSAERVDAAASSLEAAFAPGARDAVSGEPMRELYSSAELDAYDRGDLRIARARLTDAPGSDPGRLFGAFDRGSLLTYIGLQPPPPG